MYFGDCCTHSHRHSKLVSESVDAGNSLQGLISRVKKAFDKAAKYIHTNKKFDSSMMNAASVKALISETNNAFTKAVNTGISQNMPEAIRQSFKKDVFIFSGMKTYTQLKEASQLLLDEKGNIKPFQKFAQDIFSINDKYNKQYLEAEYNYAIASAQMADKWQDLAQDADRYYLQYRTAGDDRVRPEHEALNKITLPASDDFWNKYYPPNGWNCRCTVVKVLRSRYAASDGTAAQKLGETATTQLDKNGNNAAAIFRMNAGKQKIIFPPQHPYYPQYCNGAKLNMSGLIGKSRIHLASESDRCKAKSIVEKEFDKAQIKQAQSLSREEKQKIFELPYEEQFNEINVGNQKIFVHKAFTAGDDYNDLIDAAEYFIGQNKTPYVLPIIHEKDIDARHKVFRGYDRTKTSPDIFIKEDNQYWEVENSQGTPRRNVAKRIKSGLNQADNVYLILKSDEYKKFAEAQLKEKAKQFHIVIKKENQQ